MKRTPMKLALAFVLASGAAHAAGPLFTTEGANPVPYKWDTSNGPIPVYTDGGAAFTYDFDEVTPVVSIEQANEITAFAFGQWSNVPTSTFAAEVAGTIESQTGIADVTGANAGEIYEAVNGYGFWVLYDSDGSILEDYFGAPRSSVLGIAFPEWADEETGTIIEATAVMNGWYVWSDDLELERQAGVFTHEFGHAINLSHSQTNGQMAYYSAPWAGSELYPGVPGCGVDPVYASDYDWYVGDAAAQADIVETMFPFIDTRGARAVAQSTIEHPDDVAAISDLYPTDDYRATRGSIAGTIRLKDGSTEYSGINVIARNVADPLYDAVSGMSGMLTQGKVGPDGRFFINNLTPGAEYHLYIEEIVAGGYPTSPTMLLSQAEYWNEAESSDPIFDDACDATPILAEAGVTKQADFVFNGYDKGVQITPIVSAYLTDLAKNGRSSAGLLYTLPFKWDQNKGFTVLPEPLLANHGALSANGQKMLVSGDLDGNGVVSAVIWSEQGVTELGDLNGDSCGVDGSSGTLSVSGFDLDHSGNVAVGFATKDTDGDGFCQRSYQGEILPMIWEHDKGIQELETESIGASNYPWIRAHSVSGDGRVALGTANNRTAFAWVDKGQAINLTELYGAKAAYAVNYDGSRVALETANQGLVFWNARTGETEPMGELRWCIDVPYYDWFLGDVCSMFDPDLLYELLGPVPLSAIDMNDEGTVLVARVGDFFTGYTGYLWIEDIGLIEMDEFLRKQGVVEASNLSFSGINSITAKGSKMAGGPAGAPLSFIIDADQVYVCHKGKSVLTGFPNGLRSMVEKGAEFGRCEHLD